MLAFVGALVPAAVLFGGVFLGVRFVLANHSWSLVIAAPLAAALAAVGLAIEVGLGVWLLGGLFERFDVSDEPAA